MSTNIRTKLVHNMIIKSPSKLRKDRQDETLSKLLQPVYLGGVFIF